MYNTCIHVYNYIPSCVLVSMEKAQLMLQLYIYMCIHCIMLQYVYTAVSEEEGGGLGEEGYRGPCHTGPRLWLTQAKALLVKRCFYTYRRLLAYSLQTLLPLSLVILGLVISGLLQVHVHVHVHVHLHVLCIYTCTCM